MTIHQWQNTHRFDIVLQVQSFQKKVELKCGSKRFIPRQCFIFKLTEDKNKYIN